MSFWITAGPSRSEGRLSQILTSSRHFVLSVSAPLCRSQSITYKEALTRSHGLGSLSVSAGREVGKVEEPLAASRRKEERGELLSRGRKAGVKA